MKKVEVRIGTTGMTHDEYSEKLHAGWNGSASRIQLEETSTTRLRRLQRRWLDPQDQKESIEQEKTRIDRQASELGHEIEELIAVL